MFNALKNGNVEEITKIVKSYKKKNTLTIFCNETFKSSFILYRARLEQKNHYDQLSK